MSAAASSPPIAITGVEVACCLGDDWPVIRAALREGVSGLRPLRELDAATRWPELRAGWIPERGLMLSRQYGPASALAVHLARRAVERRGWSASECAEACLFAGSSRGNLAGWLSPWPGRRQRRVYAASNNLHGEIASAVSVELGVQGGAHLLSNGCSSGLDALGMAWLFLSQGLAARAVVVAVDLPLIEPLLASFDETGLLGGGAAGDPYSPATNGFHPAEAGAAILLEREDMMADDAPRWARVRGYWSASDAFDIVGAPKDGDGMVRCLQRAVSALPGQNIAAICPHANGTAAHAQAEAAALRRVWAAGTEKPALHLLKPLLGHSLGASGAVETALLADAMRQGHLPPNPEGLTPPEGFSLPTEPVPLPHQALVLNLSVAMGGHNAVLALERVSPDRPAAIDRQILAGDVAGGIAEQK
ncbi:MAG: hypothetical protein HS117_11035 [Verrucomicrobiaceae bacterium]|nr:hypothetical protein [Verrucomicrobiaceae bacterium]